MTVTSLINYLSELCRQLDCITEESVFHHPCLTSRKNPHKTRRDFFSLVNEKSISPCRFATWRKTKAPYSKLIVHAYTLAATRHNFRSNKSHIFFVITRNFNLWFSRSHRLILPSSIRSLPSASDAVDLLRSIDLRIRPNVPSTTARSSSLNV